MTRSTRRRSLAALFVTTLLAIGAMAAAAGDDRSAAESVLAEVEASPRKEVAVELATRSRAALDRGRRLRASGDEAHAKLADRLARTWAEAARDAARAAVVEESAATARRGASDAGVVADRERALLEEAIAQSGRVRAQLEALERDTKEKPARTSKAAVDGDGGVRSPNKPRTDTRGGGTSSAPPVKAGAGSSVKASDDGGIQ